MQPWHPKEYSLPGGGSLDHWDPRGSILFNSFINDHCTNTQKRSKKSGAQNSWSLFSSKTTLEVLSPCELVGQSQFSLQDILLDKNTPGNSSAAQIPVRYFNIHSSRSQRSSLPGRSEVTGLLSHRKYRDLTSYTAEIGNFTI